MNTLKPVCYKFITVNIVNILKNYERDLYFNQSRLVKLFGKSFESTQESPKTLNASHYMHL
jgi:hypothetical protein